MGLSPDELLALGTVKRIWPDRPIVLIGASALQFHGDFTRNSKDIDITITVELEEFPGALAQQPGWTSPKDRPHAWRSPQGVLIDVLPAGPSLLERGYIDWPDGKRMSLVGFDLPFRHFVEVEVCADTMVRVASQASLTVLKMRAWLDRPSERAKDIGDIAWLMTEFVDDSDERRFDERLFDLGLTFEETAPFLLGEAVAAICEPKHEAVVLEFFSKVSSTIWAANGLGAGTSAVPRRREMPSFVGSSPRHCSRLTSLSTRGRAAVTAALRSDAIPLPRE